MLVTEMAGEEPLLFLAADTSRLNNSMFSSFVSQLPAFRAGISVYFGGV